MSLKEVISLLCSHTHSLHSEIRIAFLRGVCWMLGTQRQEAGSEPPRQPGKKEVSPSHRSRKRTSTWQLNKEPVCGETALFDFYPQSHANCKQTEWNSGSKLISKAFSNVSTTYSRLQYLLTKCGFCHINTRAFFCAYLEDSCYLNKTFNECCQLWRFSNLLIFQIQCLCSQFNI